jgi:phage gp45-like
MIDQIRELGAKLRNVFVVSDFQKRYDDGKIQVKTHNNRVVEKKEAFPYGFYAKAKNGRAFLFCQGGNLDGVEIFPVQPGDDISPPELEEGDAALYTGSGGSITVRESGDVEITNTDGDLWIVCKKGGEVEIKGKIKVIGGSFECGGSVTPTGQGALCGMPYCAYTGAPQTGTKSEGT